MPDTLITSYDMHYNVNMANPNETQETGETMTIQDAEKRIETVIANIKSSVTETGLVPELNERGKLETIDGVEGYGFNSEMLGYAMRLAVENDDRDMFERLHSGYQLLQSKGSNGLLRARLHHNLAVDESGNGVESWADGNQDVALSLLEAGQKWGKQYEEEGIRLATAFINSGHIQEVNGRLCVFNSFAEDQEKYLGERLRLVDLSMWNFRLYERMQQLQPDEVRWQRLYSTGAEVFTDTLDKFKLPPNRIPLIDGQVVSYEELFQKLDGDELLAGSLKVSKEVVAGRLADPYTEHRVYGWDAMRIPYRLADTADPRLLELSVTLYKRLAEGGNLGVNIQAETGSRERANTFSPSIAPCLTAQICEQGDISQAIAGLEASMQVEENKEGVGTFKTPLYWKMWDGLALSQVRRYYNATTSESIT